MLLVLLLEMGVKRRLTQEKIDRDREIFKKKPTNMSIVGVEATLNTYYFFTEDWCLCHDMLLPDLVKYIQHNIQ